MSTSGTLYVVATPIGNLEDITMRALRVLREVDRIAAEDTRVSRRLLDHYGIPTPLICVHEHNERAQAPKLVEQLRAGRSLALISDAGTPLVSDPGYRLVELARRAGIRIVPIPGPSAVLAALSTAGLPTDCFIFEGFLPARQAARRSRLRELRDDPRTLVLFEAGRRIQGLLEDLVEIFGGERRATLARELTKQHETLRQASLMDLAGWVAQDADQRRGELVLVIAGAPPRAVEDEELDRVLVVLLANLPLKQAASLAVQLCGVSRRCAYQRALGLRREGD